MESRGKGGKHIRARGVDIAHHAHLDGTDLAQAKPHVRSGTLQAAVNLGKAFFQVGVGLLDGHSVQVQGTQDVHIDASFRGDGSAKGGLVLAEHVDNHLIAGAQPVIARGGHVFAGIEIQSPVPENVPAIDIHILCNESGNLAFVGGLCADRMHAAHILNGDCGLIGALPALIQGIHPLRLGAGNALERKLRNNLFPGFAFCDGLLGIFQYLVVAHGALGPCGTAEQEKAGGCGHPSLGNYHHFNAYSYKRANITLFYRFTAIGQNWRNTPQR